MLKSWHAGLLPTFLGKNKCKGKRKFCFSASKSLRKPRIAIISALCMTYP